MAYNHTRSLVAAGETVEVITPRYDQQLPSEELREGFKIIRLKPFFSFGNAAFCPGITKLLNNYDVVHLHYPFFGVAGLVWLWKKHNKSNAKLVITYHMDVVGTGLKGVFFKLHRRLLMPFIIKSADKVIVTTKDYAENSFVAPLLKKYPDKFISIPPEVDTSHFYHRNNSDEILTKFNFKKLENKIILFVGGLDRAHYFKGLELLINSFSEVVKSIPSIRLVVVGSGEMLPYYQNLAVELGVGQKVIFASSVDYNELPAYYSIADLLVVSAIDKSEAFGIVTIEALCCGTPILVADLPGVRTVAEGGVGQTFKTGDKNDLLEKLQRLLTSENLKSMGELGRKKVEVTYAKEIILKKLLEVYKSV